VSTSTPLLPAQSFPDCTPVLGECFRICVGAKLVQKPHRPLDVGEEERDGAGREFVSHAP
jgi:hypothetical protein